MMPPCVGRGLSVRSGAVSSRRGRRHALLAETQLLVMITLWALNVSAAKYVLTHGFGPAAYVAARYVLAAAIATVYTRVTHRAISVDRRDLPRVIIAGLLFAGNQATFVASLSLASAASVALIFGATPVVTAVVAIAAGLGRPTRRYWVAAGVSLAGVGLIASASGSASSSAYGDLVALLSVVLMSTYSVVSAPLMARYAPHHVFTLVLVTGCIPLAAVGAPDLAQQSWSIPTAAWLLFAYGVIGSLLIASILWYATISRLGPARASLIANLEPFLAAVFAILLLSEHLGTVAVVGGGLVFAGIAVDRAGLQTAWKRTRDARAFRRTGRT